MVMVPPVVVLLWLVLPPLLLAVPVLVDEAAALDTWALVAFAAPELPAVVGPLIAPPVALVGPPVLLVGLEPLSIGPVVPVFEVTGVTAPAVVLIGTLIGMGIWPPVF